MKENKIIVVINKPIEEVFEFTINPKSTPLWISSIQEEIAEEYPPKIGTQYKNRGEGNNWDFYKVWEFEKDKLFLLSNLEEDYFVKYTYKKINKNRTEMEYFEWVSSGELKKPFTEDVLERLKLVLENKK